MSFSFLNFFSHRASTQNKSGSDTLSNTAKIGNLLQQLIDDRNLLTINIPGVDNSYTSAVLSVDIDNKHFHLDELSPYDGHQLFMDAKSLTISGQSRGVLFSFTVTLKHHSTDRGIAYYEFDFPKSVNYLQRRAFFRAQPKGDKHITVTTQHKESGTAISGYVIDISIHGICILFNTDRSIQRGDCLTHCKLRLPDGQQIIFDLDVRHSQSVPSERLRVGGSFTNINSRDSQLVARLVRKLERTALRK